MQSSNRNKPYGAARAASSLCLSRRPVAVRCGLGMWRVNLKSPSGCLLFFTILAYIKRRDLLELCFADGFFDNENSSGFGGSDVVRPLIAEDVPEPCESSKGREVNPTRKQAASVPGPWREQWPGTCQPLPRPPPCSLSRPTEGFWFRVLQSRAYIDPGFRALGLWSKTSSFYHPYGTQEWKCPWTTQ